MYIIIAKIKTRICVLDHSVDAITWRNRVSMHRIEQVCILVYSA